MQCDQFAEKVGIGRVILGPARGERLAITRQGHRIDRKKHNEVIAHQGMDEPAGGLLQAQRESLMRKPSTERRDPSVKRFGAAFNHRALDLALPASLQADIDFLVRFIQANEGGVMDRLAAASRCEKNNRRRRSLSLHIAC